MRVTERESYKEAWRCRDMEISLLWTRLTLLGTFMLATYAGYGIFAMEMLKGRESMWTIQNLVAIAICCFGAVFSALWIITAKGSKAWYEIYESIIWHLQKNISDKGGSDIFLTQHDFKNPKILSRMKICDCLLSARAGWFSVSKIPILMGQVSFAGWVVLGVMHLAFLSGTRGSLKEFADGLGMELGWFMILVCAGVVVCAWRGARSSALKAR